MLINIKIIGNIKPLAWDKIALHPLQTWEWGEARKEMGIDVLRLGEYKDDKLIDCYQITFHRVPHTKYKIGYLPKSVFPSILILDKLLGELKKRNVIFVKIEPISKIEKLDKYHILESPHPLFTKWNQILDITKSEEELLSNMKSKTRYNIKLSQKKGVVVKEMTNNEGFNIFSKLYFETCKRQNYRGHTEFYHRTIFKHFKDKISHILIAFYKNEPLCAYHLFHHLDTIYYTYGGSSIQYKNIMAPNLLMWESIKLGKKLGCKVFDMWGSLSPDYDKEDSWAGFTRFKEGYGTKFIQTPGSYDVVLSPILYRIYTYIYIIRKKLI